MDNESLVSLLQSHSHQAWNEFFNRNNRGIEAYFLRWGVPSYQAEDLVQETFIAAYQSLSGSSAVKSLPSWLYGIARHIFYRYLRERHPDHQPMEPITPFGDPSRLKQLSPRQMEVLYYRLMEGLSFKEISRILGTADSTVRSVFLRAKRELENHYSLPNSSSS